jgi:D-xylose transport system ATP-binding protein
MKMIRTSKIGYPEKRPSSEISVQKFQGTGLAKAYGEAPGLAPTDFSVEAGQVLTVSGPNGAGKSTLLKGLLGSLRLDQGTVFVNGEPTLVHCRKDRVD